MKLRTVIGYPLFVVAALVLGGCGGGSKEFSAPGYPFTFDYPGGWTSTRTTAGDFGASAGGIRSVTVALDEPLDQVTIAQYKLKSALPAGVSGNRTEVDRLVKRITREAKGTASDGKLVKYGGAPGYQYVTHYPSAGGVKLTDRLTFLFKGGYEFQINCQSSPDHAGDIADGCDQILESLEFK